MKIHASGEDGFLHLTDIGQEVAKKSMSVINSLQSSSSLPLLTVKRRNRTPCRMEHVISQESFERLRDAYKPKKE